jgi:hypothetical protein
MNLGIYNFYRQNNNNKMFESASAEIGDDLNYTSLYMKQHLKKLGHEIATIDTAPLESFDAVLFLDYPTRWRSPEFRRLLKIGRIPLYLVLFESRAVRPDNWWRRNHAPFKKIFTWDPNWVDGKKYIRMQVPFKWPEFEPYAPSQAGKFCCLIASQKYTWAAEELYSERVRAIRWFEQHHPDEFDLYGQRWDRFFFKKRLSLVNPLLERFYQKYPWLPRPRNFPSARGPVPRKRDIMRQYKFSICYENAGYAGWLTEKMLDAMFAGSVPIYLGDPEAAKVVPADAFIDKNKFPDYNSLYRYLKEMSQTEYEGYRQAIHKFVHGKPNKPLSAEAFTDLIVREVINTRQSN